MVDVHRSNSLFAQYCRENWRIFSKDFNETKATWAKSFKSNKLDFGTFCAYSISNKKGAPVKPVLLFSNLGKFISMGLWLALSGALAGVGPAVSQESDSPRFAAHPELADYLAWGAVNNPAVARAAGRADALWGTAQAAGALPDLKFGWGEMIVPVETRTGPQQRVFSLSQSIPWFGTLGLKESEIAARAEAAQEGTRVQLLKVHREIRAAWYELAYLQGASRIITGNLELAKQTETASRSAYEAGSGSFADVLTAEIDREKLQTRLASLEDRQRPAAANLNLASGLEVGRAVPDIPSGSMVPDGVALPAEKALWNLLQEHNPELTALRLEMESRRQGVDLAGKAGYPDLTLGVDYIMTGDARLDGVPDSGQDPVIARVGVSIPLWGGKAGAQKEASAGWLRSASADLSDARLRLNTRFENALFAWRESGRNTELYGQVLLDSGRQALEVTAARYRSGQASYVEMVAARQTLLGLELANLRAQTDRALALNELTTLLGITPEELLARSASVDMGDSEKRMVKKS
jgi:cobalt-zinc-cadmium efflux system outer membrane protein